MKKISITALITVLLLSVFSCSKPKDDQLSGFMLVGPYTVLAHNDKINNTIFYDETNKDKDAEELMPLYKDMFEFPYTPALAPQSIAILMNDFQVNDNASAIKKIDELLLKAETADKKAFDYAVAANIANLAYAPGYLSKEELLKQNQRILKEVRKNYSEWTPYLEDFKTGRAQTGKSAQEKFEEAIDKILLETKNSPFLTLGI